MINCPVLFPEWRKLQNQTYQEKQDLFRHWSTSSVNKNLTFSSKGNFCLNRLVISQSKELEVGAGAISNNFRKGGSSSNVRKWVWPICRHTHVFKDGDVAAQSNCDITLPTSRKISIAMYKALEARLSPPKWTSILKGLRILSPSLEITSEWE